MQAPTGADAPPATPSASQAAQQQALVAQPASWSDPIVIPAKLALEAAKGSSDMPATPVLSSQSAPGPAAKSNATGSNMASDAAVPELGVSANYVQLGSQIPSIESKLPTPATQGVKPELAPTPETVTNVGGAAVNPGASASGPATNSANAAAVAVPS
ncbi:MAG: hypothetical protein WA510_05065, partial [Acidobacteriaceae bacterium]